MVVHAYLNLAIHLASFDHFDAGTGLSASLLSSPPSVLAVQVDAYNRAAKLSASAPIPHTACATPKLAAAPV